MSDSSGKPGQTVIVFSGSNVKVLDRIIGKPEKKIFVVYWGPEFNPEGERRASIVDSRYFNDENGFPKHVIDMTNFMPVDSVLNVFNPHRHGKKCVVLRVE